MKQLPTLKPIPFIRKRCPHLKGKELLEAEELFRQHLRICMRIYYRLEEEENQRKLEEAGFDSESEVA